MSMFSALVRKLRGEGEGDLVSSLVDCHVRIRVVVDLAVAIGEGSDMSASEVVEGAAQVERYFAEVYPVHVADEEESILPRLRGRSSRIDAALYQMHEQHLVHDGLVRRLVELSRALRVEASDVGSRDALAAVARPLRALIEEHLEAEEKVVFVAVRELFTRVDERCVRREMDARRRLDV